MHKLRWDDLQFVLAVAESGSFSAAARKLGVHHATVLRRISAFEEDCEVKIFERTTSGYQLTPESRHILNEIRSIDSLVGELGRSIASQGDSITGPLTLTTTDTLRDAIVLQACSDFSQRFPNTQINLLCSSQQLDLARMEADLTIRPTFSLERDLSGEYICDLGFRAYASEAYLNGWHNRELNQFQWLGLSGRLVGAPFNDWLGNYVSDKNLVMRADSFISLLGAVSSGLGVAFLPCCLADRVNQLVRVACIEEYFSTRLWIATHKDLAKSHKLKIATKHFFEALQKERKALEG